MTYNQLDHCEYKSIDECFQAWTYDPDKEFEEEYNTTKNHISGSLLMLIQDISTALDLKSLEITNIPNTLLICPRADLIDFIEENLSKLDKHDGGFRDAKYIWEDCFGSVHPYKNLQALSKKELVYLIINMENFGSQMDLFGFLKKYDRQPLIAKLQELVVTLASFQSELEKISYIVEVQKRNKTMVKFPCEDLLDCPEE